MYKKRRSCARRVASKVLTVVKVAGAVAFLTLPFFVFAPLGVTIEILEKLVSKETAEKKSSYD